MKATDVEHAARLLAILAEQKQLRNEFDCLMGATLYFRGFQAREVRHCPGLNEVLRQAALRWVDVKLAETRAGLVELGVTVDD